MSAPHRAPSPPPFPEAWPPEYLALAQSLGPRSPLLRLGTPHPSEADPDPEALADPTAEARFTPVPFVVRKHPDRAVVLATSACFFYCRFCFRRGTPPGEAREPSEVDWERVFRWLEGEPEVEEVILSGGDPLTLSDERLAQVGRRLAGLPHLRRWRLHTRAPVVAPARVTARLVAALASVPLPLRVVVHAAHPAEVRPAFVEAVARLQGAGIPVLDQTVLLAGVNDDPAVLADLFTRLGAAGVEPYYLHHPDPAPGNARFRVTPARGLALCREAEALLGRPLPPYVIDLPDGSGKVRVEDAGHSGCLRR